MNDLQILLLTIFLGLILLLFTYVVKFLKSTVQIHSATKPPEGQEAGDKDANQATKNGKKGAKVVRSTKAPESAKQKAGGKEGKSAHQQHSQQNYAHPWLVTSLKGHSGRVVDFDISSNGRYVATCGVEGTVLVWPTKSFANRNNQCIRGNVAYDEPDKIKWSPDSKAFIIHKSHEDVIEVYKLNKKADSEGGGHSISAAEGHSFPVVNGDSGMVSVDFASNGKFIVTCSAATDLVLYDLQGKVLTKLDSCLMRNFCAKISPNSNLVAVSGFTPDVKVWEVKISKSGDFEKVSRAFELTGHTSGVFHFDFNSDASKMVTVSKDGTWRVFRTSIEFTRGQDPTLLAKGSEDLETDENSKIAISPDGKVVAVSCGKDVHIFSATTAEKMGELRGVHAEPVTCLAFDAEGKWLLSSGDRHVRVFHNIPGYKLSLEELESNLKTAKTQGSRERIQEQIVSLKSTLEHFSTYE